MELEHEGLEIEAPSMDEIIAEPVAEEQPTGEVTEKAEAPDTVDEPVEDKKFWGQFDSETDARVAYETMKQRDAAIAQQQQAQQEAYRRQAMETQLAEADKQAVAVWRQLVAEGRGDEAFLFMQQVSTQRAAAIAEAKIEGRLSEIQEFHRGKQMFLADKAVADVHPNVEQIASLIQQGWSEKDAVAFIRSIKGRSSASPEQRQSASRKVRDQSYMESPGGSSSTASSPTRYEKAVNLALDDMFGPRKGKK